MLQPCRNKCLDDTSIALQIHLPKIMTKVIVSGFFPENTKKTEPNTDYIIFVNNVILDVGLNDLFNSGCG